MKNLSPNVVTKRISNAVAAGATDVVCTVIDTTGFQGIRAIALLGALTATQVTSLFAEHSDDNVTFAAIAGARTSNAADADGNKMLVLEICEPTKRYLRFTVDRATANAVVDGVIAELFRASLVPVTGDASVISQVVISSPDDV